MSILLTMVIKHLNGSSESTPFSSGEVKSDICYMFRKFKNTITTKRVSSIGVHSLLMVWAMDSLSRM